MRSCSGAGQPGRGAPAGARPTSRPRRAASAPIPPGVQHLGGGGGGPDDPAPVQPGQREQRELQLGDDAEAAAAGAAQRPVQLRGAVGVDLVRAPVRGDQPQAVQVVRGEAVAAAEQAQAAAEGVAGHADPGRRGGERGEAVRRGRGEDLRPGGARADAGRAGPRVDGDGVEPAGRQQHRRGRVRGGAVTGALDPDGQPVGAGARDGGDDVVLALRADHDARAPGHGGVERGDLGGVAGVRRAQDGPGDRRQAAAAGAAGEAEQAFTSLLLRAGGEGVRPLFRIPLCRIPRRPHTAPHRSSSPPSHRVRARLLEERDSAPTRAPRGRTMPPSATAPADDGALLERTVFEVKRVIVGQDRLVERMLVGLLAKGHLLIEGVPGVAKTLAVETFARVVGGTFSRIQFTPDLVPVRPARHPDLPGRPGAVRHRTRPGGGQLRARPTRSTAPRPRCSRRCSR